MECDRCGRFEIEHELLDHFRVAYEGNDRSLVDQLPRLAEFVGRAGGMPLLSADNWRTLASAELRRLVGQQTPIRHEPAALGVRSTPYRAEGGSLTLFSLVVPAGAATPVHDHLAWGLVGIYRGRQDETVYRRLDDGSDPARARLEIAERRTLGPGQFYSLLPPADDIHFVQTVSDTPSISIHLLANDTACIWRHRFDPDSGSVMPFRSGYANAPCPPDEAAGENV